MRAFISFHHEDRVVAGNVRTFLSDIGISSFLAHEDIDVSHEWQDSILEELGKVDIFVAILSKQYNASTYCLQESGIAIFLELPIVPLSIDGSIPVGFLNRIQSRKIDPKSIDEKIVFAGLAKHDPIFVVDLLIDRVARSGSFRRAEANFETLRPFLQHASDEQMIKLLSESENNVQISNAHLCYRDYLPPLLNSHGHLLNDDVRKSLQGTIDAYSD